MDFSQFSQFIGPLVGLAIAGISGGLVWWLTRREHAEKDVIANQTLLLLSDSNKELRQQNADYRTKVDENSTQLSSLTAELRVWQEKITQRAAVDELAGWAAEASKAARDRDEALQRSLAEIRADTAMWQANEAKAREQGHAASSLEHSGIISAMSALRIEIAKMNSRGART